MSGKKNATYTINQDNSMCCLHNYVVWCAVCVRVRVCALESSPLFLALPLIVLCVALCVCMCLEPEPEPYTTF